MRLGLVVLFLASACFTMRVETRSPPTTVRLRLAQPCDAVVEQHAGAGKVHPVAVTDGNVDLEVPGMGGGYSERGGRRSNVHDPDTYAVVRLRRADTLVIELSLQQIRALPKDVDGRAIVPCAGA